MLNSKKSLNSKELSADQGFYYIHVTLYFWPPLLVTYLDEISFIYKYLQMPGETNVNIEIVVNIEH